MLKGDVAKHAWIGIGLMAAVGAGAAALVLLGNPGNMGICGVCFLRDISGAIGLFGGPGPKIVRPEVIGIVLGAFVWMVATRKYVGRAGSHAATRFTLGMLMAFGALVFLGCPFRMLQRLGGGDLNAWIGLPGFIAGVGIGLFFERRGYSVGKTAPVNPATGLFGPLSALGLLIALLAGAIPVMLDQDALPAHAPLIASLGIGLVAGAIMAATGFCAISSARQVFQRKKRMLIAACALVAVYGIVMMLAGRFNPSMQAPAAHSESLWNVLSLALVGLTGVLVGGCPVRQLVMAGEGNGDAFVTCMGLLVGGALAHNFNIASSGAGTTEVGRWTVIIGLVLSISYALWVTMSGQQARRMLPS